MKYYYSYFIDTEMEAQRVNNIPKVIVGRAVEMGLDPKALDLPRPTSRPQLVPGGLGSRELWPGPWGQCWSGNGSSVWLRLSVRAHGSAQQPF